MPGVHRRVQAAAVAAEELEGPMRTPLLCFWQICIQVRPSACVRACVSLTLSSGPLAGWHGCADTSEVDLQQVFGAYGDIEELVLESHRGCAALCSMLCSASLLLA